MKTTYYSKKIMPASIERLTEELNLMETEGFSPVYIHPVVEVYTTQPDGIDYEALDVLNNKYKFNTDNKSSILPPVMKEVVNGFEIIYKNKFIPTLLPSDISNILNSLRPIDSQKDNSEQLQEEIAFIEQYQLKKDQDDSHQTFDKPQQVQIEHIGTDYAPVITNSTYPPHPALVIYTNQNQMIFEKVGDIWFSAKINPLTDERHETVVKVVEVPADDAKPGLEVGITADVPVDYSSDPFWGQFSQKSISHLNPADKSLLNDSQYPITIVVPCYGRPERTLRAINSVIEQDFPSFQAIFIGDNCHLFEEKLKDGTYGQISKTQFERGRLFEFLNLRETRGGWGYHARNIAKKMIKGDYVCFLDNDDIVHSHHLSNYYMSIHGTGKLLMLNNTLITNEKGSMVRRAQAERGYVGHAEMVVFSALYRNAPDQGNEYGHDWELFRNLQKNSAGKWGVVNGLATYEIRSTPDFQEKGID